MARLPAISDLQIFTVLAELRASGDLPVSGLTLRRELQRRFGMRAGTDRIYRLLQQSAPSGKEDGAATSPLIARLTGERDAALARAELAELREVATQDRTANEIHELRHKVRALQTFKT